MEQQVEANETSPSTDLQALEGQITLLTELATRVESLRQTPAYLRPIGAATTAVSIGAVVPSLGQAAQLRQGFENIKEFSEKVQSENVQDVLKAARERESKDKTDLNLTHRRKHLKRVRAPSPDSPQPYRSFQPKTSPFPPDDTASAPLRMDGLIDYIQSYNRANPFRLHIWTATPRPAGPKLSDEIIVRFTIREVITIFLIVGTTSPNHTLVVEGATAFGPREKKPPHSQSSYVVYQRLSQHLAKMLQAKPQASFQLITLLLASYEDLFVRRCSACQRVIAAEGHVPPVARIWLAADREADGGSWDARHPACLQSKAALTTPNFDSAV